MNLARLGNKYWDGITPVLHELSEKDQITISETICFAEKIGYSIENYKFREGLFE